MKNEELMPHEVLCQYARNTDVFVDEIPIVECIADKCPYERRKEFGVARTEGDKGTACLKEGRVPKDLYELMKIA